MRKFLLLTISFLLLFNPFKNANCQNSHIVNVGGPSDIFDPAVLLVVPGDTVTWVNIGGFHNVNGSLNTYPANPEGFENAVSSTSWSFTHVFTISGEYNYQCDPHVGMGMVGQVFVGCISNMSATNINNNGATLNWTTSTADVNLKWRKTGMTNSWNQSDPYVTQINNISASSQLLDTLTFNAQYEWRIKPNGCAIGGWVDAPTPFTVNSNCIPSVTQTVTNFSPDPVPGYMQWSYDTLIITNNSGCNVRVRPEFIISHSNSSLNPSMVDMRWYNPYTNAWPPIQSNSNANGELYGYWSPTGASTNDSTGFDLGASAIPQVVRIKVRLMNPNNSPPNGAPYGTYTAVWTTYEVDSLGNILGAGPLSPANSVSLQLVDCSNFSASSASTPPTCTGGNDGTALLSINNGSGNYSYLWSNGQTTNPINNLSAGTYGVLVTDLNSNCTDSISVIVNPPTPLSATLIGTNVSCNGGNDGALIATATGGSGAYNFDWANPLSGNSNTQNNVGAGTYSVTITDLACGDQATPLPVIITEPSPLSYTWSYTDNTSCTNSCNGTFEMSLSGGTTPYSYSWTNCSSNCSDSVKTDLCAGTYTITGTDANSCISFSETVTIIDAPLTPTACISGSDATCNGASDGTAQAYLSATGCGNISTLSYCASAPGNPNDYNTINKVILVGDNSTISNNTTGSCDGYEDYTTQFTDLTPGQSYSIEVEIGTCNLSGFYAPDSCTVYIDWNIDGDFDDPNEIVGKKYTGTSGPGSPTTHIIPFTVPSAIAAGATRLRVVSQYQQAGVSSAMNPCTVGNFGGPSWNQPWYGATEDYSIVITGTPIPATYLWSTGDTTSSVIGLTAGTYSCTLTDNNNCSATNSITIGEPAAITVTSSTTPTSCNGSSDGTATLISSGGTGTLTEDWLGKNPNNLPAGTHNFKVTDENGCVFNGSVTISEPSAITINETITDVSCFGGQDGSISIIANGGNGGYNYNWSNGSINTNINNLNQGTYYVIVSDNNGCSSDTANFIVNQPPQLTVSDTISDYNGYNISCNGGTDGNIAFYLSGGTSPYTLTGQFLVFNGQIPVPGSQYNVGTGIYAGSGWYYASDSKGCTTDTVTINFVEPPAISVSAVTTNATCNGYFDGTAIVTSSGGVGSLVEDWGGLNPSALAAGTYIYTITDDNSCSKDDTITILEPNPITISETITDVSCFGGQDGTISVSVNGGNTNATTWTENWFGANPDSLSASTYPLVVTDPQGCSDSTNYTVNQPLAITVSEIITNASCNGFSDGSAILSYSGGTGTLTEYWFGADSSALSAGDYNYQIIDDNGCTYNDSVSINEAAALIISLNNTSNVTDCASPDGSIDISITGGNGNYNILWDNNATTEDLTNITAGNYNVNVSDPLGCNASFGPITITNPTPINWTIDSTNFNGYAVSCNSSSDGEIYISTSGGVGNITYSWSGLSSNNDTVTGLSAGLYTVIATDDANCTSQQNIQIHAPNALVVSTSTTQLNCNSSNTVFAVTLNISGGIGPYIKDWGGLNPNALPVGTHNYTVTDVNGCVYNGTIICTPATQITLNLYHNDVLCYGESTGSLGAIVTPNNGIYTFLWSNGATLPIVNNVPAGMYTLTVTDNNGCTVTDSIMVSQPSQALTPVLTALNSIDCFGNNSGSAQVSAFGGTPPYSFLWEDNINNTTTADSLFAGWVKCTVTDTLGCSVTDSVEIIQNAEIIVSYIQTGTILCYEDSTGAILITNINGGNSGNPNGFFGYSGYWLDLPSNNPPSSLQRDSLVGGNYTLRIIDATGCIKDEIINVYRPNKITATITSTNGLNCWGDMDGAADITISGGTPGNNPTYTLNEGFGPFNLTGTTYSFLNRPAGVYPFTITDGIGCTKDTSITINHASDSLYFAFTVSNYNGVNISCKGYNNGFINIDSIVGGIAPHNFSWSNGDTNPSIDSLTANWYSGTVTDSLGCSFTQNFLITEPDFALETHIDTFSVTCNNYCDGKIVANSSFGTAPYAYSLEDINTGVINTQIDSIFNVCAGSYALTVTDTNGCINYLTTTIFEPLQISITLNSITDASQNGYSNGSISTSASGGNGGYIYLWSNGASTANISNLSAGTYHLVVSDINGCISDTATFIINEPPALDINLDTIQSKFTTTCYSLCDGEIWTNPVLSPPQSYNIFWTGPNGFNSTSPNIDNLCGGDYSMFITTSNDTTQFNFTIHEPDSLVMTIDTINGIICHGGNVLVSAYTYGGVQPYSWLWSNNSINISASLDSGTHIVTVTDALGCQLTDSVTLSQPDSVQVIAIDTPPLCHNGNDGKITAGVVNNTNPPYHYSLDNFFTQQPNGVFENLSPGSYTVSVSDGDGCIGTTNITINNPAPIQISTTNNASSADTVSCYGECDGQVSFNYLNINGNPNQVIQQWTNGANNGDLCPGTYSCTFTDINGCMTTLNNIIVLEADPIVVNNINTETPTCYNNGDDGEVQVFAAGGANPLSYQWYGIPTSSAPGWFVGNNPTNLTPGSYTCTMIDANGCEEEVTVTINANTTPFLISIGYTGVNSGATLSLDPQLPNIQTYLWSTGETDPSITVSNNGQYSLVVTDNNGCVSDTAYYVVIDFGVFNSIEEINNNSIFIYPNPTYGNIFIEAKDIINKIVVFNHLGENVLTKSINSANLQKEQNINLSNFAKGIYHIQITINNEIINHKIILK